jgi:hypothetical protein
MARSRRERDEVLFGNGKGEGRMIFRVLVRILLYCLKLTLDSHSHSAQGLKEKAQRLPAREEGEEAVMCPGFSRIAPCLNGCIGTSPMGEETTAYAVTAGFDSDRASCYPGGKGHEDCEIRYSARSLPMS